MSPILSVRQLKKSFEMPSGTLQVLHGMDFDIAAGECVAITGQSGSGKSTLMHILGTLDSPSSGTVTYDGVSPFGRNDKELSHFRNAHIGFVFQQNNLLPEFNALENICLPGFLSGKLTPKEVRARGRELLDLVGLSSRSEHHPGQLSGGEQQRVAIARALINSPQVVLADEPSGNLDSQTASRIHSLFLDINSATKATFLIVTHNPAFAALLPRCLHMADGRLISDTRLGASA